MKLIVATCQFPVDADIRSNIYYVLRQMRDAKARGADAAHFPEACLSGYAGVDFATYRRFNWNLLSQCTPRVLHLARELKLWVVLGSTHRLTGPHKPHDSLYIINDEGELVDRYDKMFCAGDHSGKVSDLAHYSPGNHFAVFDLKGVRCGALICHEYRYPELYREYKKRGVQLIFHSYHAGHVTPKHLKTMEAQVGDAFHKYNPASTLPGITMPAAMHAAAASNHVWISCSNTSARESCWPSFFVRPDGVITGRLRRNTAGVLLTTVNTNADFYDSTVAWREHAMHGVFHSGQIVRDKRSDQRRQL